MKRKLIFDFSTEDDNSSPTKKAKTAGTGEYQFTTNILGNIIPIFRYDQNLGKGRCSSGTFIIHPVSTLNRLITQTKPYFIDRDVKLRFLLTSDLRLLFAPSGVPKSEISNQAVVEPSDFVPPYAIPDHAQMTGEKNLHSAECISAGYIFFDSEMNVVEIDNFSMNFRSSARSLQYALLALFSCRIPFAERVKLVTDTQGEEFYDREMLTMLLTETFSAELQTFCAERNVSQAPTVVVYSPAPHSGSFFRSGKENQFQLPQHRDPMQENASQGEGASVRKRLDFSSFLSPPKF